MTQVARFDPFTGLVDDLFKGFFVRPVYQGDAQARPLRLQVDVAERGDAYVVTADLPGVRKDDIQVTIDGAQVTLSAQAKREHDKDDRVLHAERAFGKVTRSFTLPQEVDSERANAKFTDGVLELSLPKKAVNARKRLTIH